MLFAVDVGNTNIVLGCIDDNGVSFIERLSTDTKATEMEYAIRIKNVFDIHNVSCESIEGCIISSVVPQLTDLIRKAAGKLMDVPVKIVGPGVKTGLNIRIDDPATLGSDLLVDSVAAIAEYPVPAIIIDMGTATTFCVINSKKQYIGGLVVPGVKTSLQSLVNNTSLLQHISLQPPKKLIGSNTMDAMRGGIIYGNASMVDGMIDRIRDEVGEECTLIATGGLARDIIPWCRHNIVIDDDLLLKGLKLIYEKNKKQHSGNAAERKDGR